jgi:hypothetical protein
MKPMIGYRNYAIPTNGVHAWRLFSYSQCGKLSLFSLTRYSPTISIQSASFSDLALDVQDHKYDSMKFEAFRGSLLEPPIDADSIVQQIEYPLPTITIPTTK